MKTGDADSFMELWKLFTECAQAAGQPRIFTEDQVRFLNLKSGLIRRYHQWEDSKNPEKAPVALAEFISYVAGIRNIGSLSDGERGDLTGRILSVNHVFTRWLDRRRRRRFLKRARMMAQVRHYLRLTLVFPVFFLGIVSIFVYFTMTFYLKR